MSDDLVTHSALAESLGVSDRTLQRLADAYSEVHDPLPRVTPRSRQRLFPQRAVERIRAAHQLMCDVPGMRAADALKVTRDGMTFLYCPANSSEINLPTPVMAELHALHSEITNLRGEVANLRTLLLALLEHGQVPLPGGPLGLRLDGPTDSPSTAQVFPQLLASWPVGLQPNLTRLLSDLQAGYALVEVRGEVVLLTPSGQQVRWIQVASAQRDPEGLRFLCQRRKACATTDSRCHYAISFRRFTRPIKSSVPSLSNSASTARPSGVS